MMLFKPGHLDFQVDDLFDSPCLDPGCNGDQGQDNPGQLHDSYPQMIFDILDAFLKITERRHHLGIASYLLDVLFKVSLVPFVLLLSFVLLFFDCFLYAIH